MQKLLIYGAGGHAKVIVDILHQCRDFEIAGLIDDNPEKVGEKLLGEEVIGTFSDLVRLSSEDMGLTLLAIGDNRTRFYVWRKLEEAGIKCKYVTAIHPSAILGGEVTLGEGTVVMAGTIINACSNVGRHSIVNTGSSVDHDCRIGDFVHIAPGAVLCGGVSLGELSLVGVGAKVLPGVNIGREVVVGAGAVVTRDVPDSVCVVGVPARALRRRSKHSLESFDD
jgi:sugar O-acyltransferase (sialic acid O-acetyltransferase NeuD family)